MVGHPPTNALAYLGSGVVSPVGEVPGGGGDCDGELEHGDEEGIDPQQAEEEVQYDIASGIVPLDLGDGVARVLGYRPH